MNPQQQSRLIKVLILLIIMAFLAALFLKLEWVEELVDHGYSDEAKRQPFLAATLFLTEQGISAHSVKGLNMLDDLPDPATSMLVMAATQRVLSQRRFDALWQWVDAGGHLVTNVAGKTNVNTGEINDPLLAALGVEAHAVSGDSRRWRKSATGLSGHPSGQSCLSEQYLFDVAIEAERSLDIALYSGLFLVDTQDTLQSGASNENGFQLLQYEVGEGAITVFTELALWSNRRVGCYDHAYLLSILAGDDDVWFLHHIEMPSLLAIIWQEASVLVCLLGLLLSLWLWRRGQRFGPLLLDDNRQRRRLLEHLYASAMYAWRKGYIDNLVDELRQIIRSRMLAHHPNFSVLSSEEQNQIIARIGQRPVSEVQQAMQISSIKKTLILLDTVQTLQAIRKKL